MFWAARTQVVGRKNRGCENAQRSAGVNCAQSGAGGPKYSSRAVFCPSARTAPTSDVPRASATGVTAPITMAMATSRTRTRTDTSHRNDTAATLDSRAVPGAWCGDAGGVRALGCLDVRRSCD
jgi:hypothetical protein